MAFVHNINVRNVNGALPQGLRILRNMGLTEDSRNGPVQVAKGPVMTIYQKPTERVLFSPTRDANPFFHLFESLWMLAGRNDLPWLVQFNKRFAAYSDDGGKTQPAAYGHRWRNYFGYDQLDAVVAELSANPGSRRAVLAMWDGGYPEDGRSGGDLNRALVGSADIPCNTHCYFRVLGGALHMTVMCRSNDALWGAYGANAVHFSVLLEYLAAKLGLEVGVMYQLSNNFHYYVDIVGDAIAMAEDAEAFDLYATEKIKPVPMFIDPERFMAELPAFMEWADPEGFIDRGSPVDFHEPFLAKVAVPMRQAWGLHKVKDYGAAEALTGAIAADDWRIASRRWIERRAKNHRAKSNG